MTMRRAVSLFLASSLLLVSALAGGPAAATDENFYGHKWPNGVFQSLPYATGNISYFNGAGEALSIIHFGPNTITAMPDNDMAMWYAGSDWSSFSWDPCSKINVWYYQEPLNTTELARTYRCPQPPSTAPITGASVLLNSAPVNFAWHVQMGGYIWETWRFDLAAAVLHETVHTGGWSGHWIIGPEFPWETMSEPMNGGVMWQRSLELHETNNIKQAY